MRPHLVALKNANNSRLDDSAELNFFHFQVALFYVHHDAVLVDILREMFSSSFLLLSDSKNMYITQNERGERHKYTTLKWHLKRLISHSVYFIHFDIVISVYFSCSHLAGGNCSRRSLRRRMSDPSDGGWSGQTRRRPRTAA
jgi:hypothetical protein